MKIIHKDAKKTKNKQHLHGSLLFKGIIASEADDAADLSELPPGALLLSSWRMTHKRNGGGVCSCARKGLLRASLRTNMPGLLPSWSSQYPPPPLSGHDEHSADSCDRGGQEGSEVTVSKVFPVERLSFCGSFLGFCVNHAHADSADAAAEGRQDEKWALGKEKEKKNTNHSKP